MREIKFRVWDLKHKEFVYSYKNRGLLFGFGCLSDEDMEMFGGHGLHDIITNSESYDVVVQQFTGMYDKNKTPIYEGDLLEFTYSDDGKVVVAEVRYSEKFGSFIVVVDKIFELTSMLIEHASLFKVRGNIFETSELL